VAGRIESEAGSPSKLPPTARFRMTKYGLSRIDVP
jgi:hypothetical protein